jgi:choline dehydrogenase-like flavoprotein
MEQHWDYIIVGAGSAGCVLAERLSADPRHRVLLLEAGPDDRSPFVHMPRGAAKLYGDAKRVWFFQTQAHDDIPAEMWIRGKMLGGSSSVNGMMYFRGQPQDYDGWEALGAKGWARMRCGAAQGRCP